MTETEIKAKIIERAAEIAKVLVKGNDCEIRKDRLKGIKVIVVSKREAL